MAVSPPFTIYSETDRTTVIFLVVAGLISLVALLVLLAAMFFLSKSKKYTHTHFQAYIVCLLLANAMQAWGNTMSFKWVQQAGVVDGPFCAAQGGLIQGGNIGSALWSLILSLHLFNLLFLRYKTSRMISWWIIAFVWSFIFTIVFLGPVGIQTVARGPYFGIERLSCWITDNYRMEQIFLEYLIEYMALFLNVLLHTATLMRVRGNLLRVDGKWRLRFVPLGDSWQLALGRDFTDSTMLRLAQHMVLYPLVYAATIFPVSFVRLAQFRGADIPAWAEVVTVSIFNLNGFLNVLLFFGARRFFPEPGSIPEFTVSRKDVDAVVAQHGVTPFTLQRPASEASSVLDISQVQADPVSLPPPAVVHEVPERVSSRRRFSMASINSVTPLNIF
ncbi:hypothetical protein DFH07DRAFT_294704 [Mycena maculata]|uniref:Glucose receptor Git3 N-terminal domain-containing protein n=1 Tax=Mycena maculata TaxID=230809 RepID=A0AAD7MKZ0_9AGAR|nr:hypothetical protein DFH07DRAFT_294704 [Mycena maculata]